jgi:hypothetical protein
MLIDNDDEIINLNVIHHHYSEVQNFKQHKLSGFISSQDAWKNVTDAY